MSGVDHIHAGTVVGKLEGNWINENKDELTKMEGRFLRHELKHNKSPFARFYLTLKAHKVRAVAFICSPASIYFWYKFKLVGLSESSF